MTSPYLLRPVRSIAKARYDAEVAKHGEYAVNNCIEQNVASLLTAALSLTSQYTHGTPGTFTAKWEKAGTHAPKVDGCPKLWPDDEA